MKSKKRPNMGNKMISNEKALVPYSNHDNLPTHPIKVTNFTLIRLLIGAVILLGVGLALVLDLADRKSKEIKENKNNFYTIHSLIFKTDTIFKLDTVVMKEVIYSAPISNQVVTKEQFIKHVGVSPLAFAIIHTADMEGFRGTPYPDGKYHSVGFGWNLSPDHVKVAESLLNRPMSVESLNKKPLTNKEGYILLEYKLKSLMELYSKSVPVAKDNVCIQVALAIKGYARGKNHIKKDKMFTCCNGIVGCGNPNRKIRASHNLRRLMETTTASSDLDAIKRIYKYHESALKSEGLESILRYAKNN